MNGFKLLGSRIKGAFKRPKLASRDEVHWVDHIHDEYVNASQKSVGMYCNLHGFKEGGEGNWTYWVGVDIRFIGIRVQDFVIKCKNKSTYDYWIGRVSNKGPEGVLDELRRDFNLYCHEGDDVNVNFKFRWSDEEKHFNVHLYGDIYAEEK